MPRTNIDYSKTSIYKLCSNDLNIKEISNINKLFCVYYNCYLISLAHPRCININFLYCPPKFNTFMIIIVKFFITM